MAALSYTGKKLNGAELAGRLREQLPPYAVPLFLRLRAEQDTTATFKYRKVDLKRAGFDPQQIDEPLYVLLDAQRGYERLTPEIFGQIQRRELRF
jgi:hypothetical protein